MSVGASQHQSVEVLIVSYNCEAMLEACLRSIEANLPKALDLRVGVLDNGSIDGTTEMLRTRFPDVRLIESPSNLGFGRANNELVRTSSADYVMLLNPDTLWQADPVTPLLECLERDPLAIAAGPKLIFPDGRRQASNRRLPTLPQEIASIAETVLRGTGAWTDRHISRSHDDGAPEEVDFLWATCWLMRREDIEATGLFDEAFTTYDEDADFCARMRAIGRTFVYQPRAVVVHIGGGTANARVRGDLMRTARKRYYRRWRGRGAAFGYGALVGSVGLVGRVLRGEALRGEGRGA